MNFSAPTPSQKNNACPIWHETYECQACLALNARLSARITQLTEQDIIRRNHYLGSRYENTYVAQKNLPEMGMLVDVAIKQAARILTCKAEALRMAWWLNIMRPGDITYAHAHDAGDELLSGAYYIDVPPDGGNLVLMQDAQRVEIAPLPGLFVFFAPFVVHEVTRNVAHCPRISVGFNIGRDDPNPAR